MTILNIEGLTKDFGGLRALNDVTLNVQQGEILGLIGPNGSGKTTMLNVITGFLRTTTGITTYKGQRLTGLKPHQIADKGVTRTCGSNDSSRSKRLKSLLPSTVLIRDIPA